MYTDISFTNSSIYFILFYFVLKYVDLIL